MERVARMDSWYLESKGLLALVENRMLICCITAVRPALPLFLICILMLTYTFRAAGLTVLLFPGIFLSHAVGANGPNFQSTLPSIHLRQVPYVD